MMRKILFYFFLTTTSSLATQIESVVEASSSRPREQASSCMKTVPALNAENLCDISTEKDFLEGLHGWRDYAFFKNKSVFEFACKSHHPIQVTDAWKKMTPFREAIMAWVHSDTTGFFKDISMEQNLSLYLRITWGDLETLAWREIRRCLLDDAHGIFKDLTPQERWKKALSLSPVEKWTLAHPHYQKAMKDKIFTFDQAVNLTCHQETALNNDEIYQMLRDGRLSVHTFLNLDDPRHIKTNLKTPMASVYTSFLFSQADTVVDQSSLYTEEASSSMDTMTILSTEKLDDFYKGIREWPEFTAFKNKTVNESLSFVQRIPSWEKLKPFTTIVMEGIKNDKEGFFKDFTPEQRKMRFARLTWGHLLRLAWNPNHRWVLRNVYGMFNDFTNRQRFQIALFFRFDGMLTFMNPFRKQALKDEIFTFDQVLNLKFSQQLVLYNQRVYQVLKDGRLSARDFLGIDAPCYKDPNYADAFKRYTSRICLLSEAGRISARPSYLSFYQRSPTLNPAEKTALSVLKEGFMPSKKGIKRKSDSPDSKKEENSWEKRRRADQRDTNSVMDLSNILN